MIFYEQQANVKYDPKLQQQIPKEELERIKMEQIKLELQNPSPQYIDTKILGDTLTWRKNEEYTNRFE